MGNSLVYFVDTDLPTNKEALIKEFEKRIGSRLVLTGFDKSPYSNNTAQPGEWCLWCGDEDLATTLKGECLTFYMSNPTSSVELNYYNNVFGIEISVGDKSLWMSHGRYNLFCQFLSEETEETLKELKTVIDLVNTYAKPLIHCSRLFICGDQMYSEEHYMWDEMIYEGLSIDDILKQNQRDKETLPVYTWDNLDVIMKEYVDWGFFDFNLSEIPDYLV